MKSNRSKKNHVKILFNKLCLIGEKCWQLNTKKFYEILYKVFISECILLQLVDDMSKVNQNLKITITFEATNKCMKSERSKIRDISILFDYCRKEYCYMTID